ncbi:hypothetical protein [Paracidovorax anthurii]|uniref:Lipoprotein n=1 Tax=Paracidovorax anthurii TaxID=78229 RepID=A0A328YRM9_9BURK|nr:hypothetical protein [Paracidovorax anthurii]RAR76671.1 hypothetical protein AX018_104416 [Paracidovorax anthurii]
MPRFFAPALLAATLSLAGCSPSLDWRTVDLEGAGLGVMLPCKPDRAVRTVAWDGRSMELAMAGCDADGATFAVSHMVLQGEAGAAQADAALGRWHEAVRGRMQASADAAAPFTLPGALALPQSVRAEIHGVRPGDGRAVVAHAVWFARAEATGAEPRMRLYHAVVYAPEPRPAVADTFFAGLVLR